MKSIKKMLLTFIRPAGRFLAEGVLSVLFSILAFGVILVAIYFRQGVLGTFLIIFTGLLLLMIIHWAVKRFTRLGI